MATGTGLGCRALWVMVGLGGCAVSHPASEEPGSTEALGESEVPGARLADAGPEGPSRCGAPDGQAPILLGLGEVEVWMQRLGEAPFFVHGFDADELAHAQAAPDTLRQSEPRLVARAAGEHVLVTLAAPDAFYRLPVRAHSRVLLGRDGEVRWARRWAEGQGGEVRAFGADGSLLLESEAGYRWVRPDGSERALAPGFSPFEAPDAEGWLGGVFLEDGQVSGYGFQHVETDARRVVEQAPRPARERGRLQLVDGRFHHALLDQDGQAWVIVTGPEQQWQLALDDVHELPELLAGPTHSLVHVAGRPVALLERESRELTPLVAPPLPDGWLELRVDGDWFVAHADTPTAPADPDSPFHLPPPARAYRVHAPSASLDTEPAPAVADGRVAYAYASCSIYSPPRSLDGRLIALLAPSDVPEPAPVQLHLERADGQGWEPLGRPVVLGTDHTLLRAGDSYLLQSDDVTRRYCAFRPTGDASELADEVLVGRSAQVIAPDGALIAFSIERPITSPPRDLTLSADGTCALETGADGARLHDLLTHEATAVELPNPRLLYPAAGGAPYSAGG